MVDENFVLLAYDAMLILNQFLRFSRTALCLKYCEMINQWHSVTSKQTEFSSLMMSVKLLLWFHILLVAIGVDDCKKEIFHQCLRDLRFWIWRLHSSWMWHPILQLPFPCGLLLYSEGDRSTCIRNFGTYCTKPHGIIS